MLFQSDAEAHSSGTSGIFGRKPKAFGFLHFVELLPVHPLDVDVGQYQIPPVAMAKSQRAREQRWPDLAGIIIRVKIAFHEEERFCRLEKRRQRGEIGRASCRERV